MTAIQIPDAFSQVFGLGDPMAYYPAKNRNRWGILIMVFVLFAGVGGALLWGAYHAYSRYLKFGPAIIVSSIAGPWTVAGIFFLIALGLSWSVYKNWKKAAVVYQNGIAYRDRTGLRFWQWSEIYSMTSSVTKHYTNGIYTGTTHIYTLNKKDGDKFVLNNAISNIEELATTISKNIFPLLYEEFAEAYNQGKLCLFGPVKLSKSDGIQIGRKIYPWHEVEQVAIQKGVLSVKKRGGSWFSGASATASSIPNLQVMLSIIDQVVGLQTG